MNEHTPRNQFTCAHTPDYKHLVVKSRSLKSMRNCGWYIFLSLLHDPCLYLCSQRESYSTYMSISLCVQAICLITIFSTPLYFKSRVCFEEISSALVSQWTQTFDGQNTVVNVKRLCFVYHRVDLPYQSVGGTFILWSKNLERPIKQFLKSHTEMLIL